MQCTLPCPGRRLYLRMLVLLMVLVMTSMEWAPAPEILWMKSSMPFSQNLYTSKRRSLKFLLSRDGCPVWIHMSQKHLGILRFDLQRWSRISVLSPHVCASSRRMQPQHQMYPVRRDPGLRWNKLTVPQPQGPMGQDHQTCYFLKHRRRTITKCCFTTISLRATPQRNHKVDRYPLG